MSETKKDLKGRLKTAIYVCQSAGKALMALRDLDLPLKMVGTQLKSTADIAADKWIRTIIESIYPNDYIISEETDNKIRSYKLDKFWVLDPLDGTKSYHGGYNGFCVQIAYVDNKQIQIAVVYWPVKNKTYWAIKDQGSYVEFKRKTTKLMVSKKRKIYIDSHRARGRCLKIIQELGTDKFMELGSYGLKICNIAEGKADIFIKNVPSMIWDIAPGSLILSEAGGTLTTWKGEAFVNPFKDKLTTLLVSSKDNHKEFLDKIKLFNA